jgi:IS30 family transposase
MEKEKHGRLTYQERVLIETLLSQNKSKAFIANRLNRHKSTIGREVNPWGKAPGSYDADLADWCATEVYLNKRNKDKISTHPKLKSYVYKKLEGKLSPEQIAGRIKLDYPGDKIMTISHEAIYLHIYRQPQGKENKRLIALLAYHKSRRRSSKQVCRAKGRIKGGVSIDLRPPHIEARTQAGHWEGDLMIGINQGSAIATLVERKTRFTYIIKLKDRKSETVTNGFKIHLNKLHANLKRTMTYDNGFEMANHKWLTEQTGTDIYFAHPYSSWERGTNENTNGLIRRFLPKGTDFNLVPESELKSIENQLNNRPRKILQYLTPNEALKLEILNNRNQSVNVRR